MGGSFFFKIFPFPSNFIGFSHLHCCFLFLDRNFIPLYTFLFSISLDFSHPYSYLTDLDRSFSFLMLVLSSFISTNTFLTIAADWILRISRKTSNQYCWLNCCYVRYYLDDLIAFFLGLYYNFLTKFNH